MPGSDGPPRRRMCARSSSRSCLSQRQARATSINNSKATRTPATMTNPDSTASNSIPRATTPPPAGELRRSWQQRPVRHRERRCSLRLRPSRPAYPTESDKRYPVAAITSCGIRDKRRRWKQHRIRKVEHGSPQRLQEGWQGRRTGVRSKESGARS